ncbi:S8 family serine peptidase [Parvularcula maris]|uniref:S8 family serine peptidase n=1 Tax=Parvularcula maris TaxID=2965077 RepID=A0A9X2RJK4_9PROT|nr:S8 family serine peptidase [Parvularcula maris]MCQ8184833.1 S8 family serine peptidase [Parvularcula maris]
MAAFSLAACGGGGGSSTPQPPARSPAPAPSPPPPSPPPPPPAETFVITGQGFADPKLVADSDTNYAGGGGSGLSNNSPGTAQAISSEAEIRGWIYCNGVANPGGCQAGSDEEDFYRAELKAGQRISLEIADFDPDRTNQLDLDLYLYDDGGELVTFSYAFASKIEQIIVPQDGSYFIRANAFAGRSNYILTVSPPATTGPPSQSAVRLDTMAADRLTVLRDEALSLSPRLRRADRSALNAARGRKGGARQLYLDPAERGEADDSERIVSTRYLTEARRKALGAEGLRRYEAKLALLREVKTANTAAQREVLQTYAYPRLHSVDPPPNPDLQWNLGAVRWQQALEEIELREPGGVRRPLIAVLDSGVLSSHPKIAPVLVDARDFVPDFIDGDDFDAEAEEIVDLNDADNDECFSYHGTHVASIATAPREGGPINGTDMVGGAPFADLMMLKLGYSIGEQCGLIVGDVPAAIRYAAGLPNVSGELPPRRADVINMSFGGDGPDAATRQAIAEAVAAGVIVVASGGNDGDQPNATDPNYPAALPDVIAVAATDFSDNRAPYSSFYPQIELAAPGGDNRNDSNTDGRSDGIIGAIGRVNNARTSVLPRFGLYQGTSMASPMAAAGFALMKAVYPELTSEQAHRLIEEGLLTDDIGAPGRDNGTGFGLVNYEKMVETAFALRDGTLNLRPSFRAEPAAIDFGNIGTEVVLTISRLGEPSFSITNVVVELLTPSAPVGPAAPISVDAQGFGTYAVQVDRQGLEAGSYTGTVFIETSDGQSKTVPIAFEVAASSLEAETDTARVQLQLLEEGGGFRTVQSFSFGGAGQYFDILDVEAGTYRLLFSTDMDGDLGVCDPGELGGTFPGGPCDSPETFVVPAETSEALELVLQRAPE